jgi:nickel/cobalt transporter (NiCoT) family protein
MRRTLLALYGVLAAGNIAAWAAALIVFRDRPVLLGTALLAYGFGLRHAVDADHIAAIDNVTRKLMQRGERPVAAGFYFSLGHASVVLLAVMALALATGALERNFAALHEWGTLVGTVLSVLVLFALAGANVIVLGAVWRSYRAVRRGGRMIEAELDRALDRRGLMGRLFGPLLHRVGKSWHMYPLGVLFGLGFDTATEVALLGIAAAEAAKGLSLGAILIFPALFAAGMALVDTTDSVLMVGAYGWAFAEPLRKLYYNLAVTLASVVVALAVGGIEALGLVAGRLGLTGPFWSFVGRLNGNFTGLGFIIIALFVAAWLVSALLWRLRVSSAPG